MPQISDISSRELSKINKLQNKRHQQSTHLSPLWWGIWKPVWFSFLFYRWKTRGVLAYQSTPYWKLPLGIWKPALYFCCRAFWKSSYWCIVLSHSSDIKFAKTLKAKPYCVKDPCHVSLPLKVYWSLSRSSQYRLPIQVHGRPFSSITTWKTTEDLTLLQWNSGNSRVQEFTVCRGTSAKLSILCNIIFKIAAKYHPSTTTPDWSLEYLTEISMDRGALFGIGNTYSNKSHSIFSPTKSQQYQNPRSVFPL